MHQIAPFHKKKFGPRTPLASMLRDNLQARCISTPRIPKITPPPPPMFEHGFTLLLGSI